MASEPSAPIDTWERTWARALVLRPGSGDISASETEFVVVHGSVVGGEHRFDLTCRSTRLLGVRVDRTVLETARPVPEGDRARCRAAGSTRFSFPGRACHPSTVQREGMAMTIVEMSRPVAGGVDTHLDAHVAAALDANGGVLGRRVVPDDAPLGSLRCPMAVHVRSGRAGRCGRHRRVRRGPVSLSRSREAWW